MNARLRFQFVNGKLAIWLAVIFLVGILAATSLPLVTHAQDVSQNGFGTANTGFFDGIIVDIASFTYDIARWLLVQTGIAFNLAIFKTVFEFKNFIGVNSEGMLAAWTMLRDLANIGLIFGFVLIGLATILDIHGYEVKKTLPRLIIFAVLLNFSLLASQAVIDTSNVFSSALYTYSSAPCAESVAQNCITDANYGPAGYIIQAAGITTFLNYTPPNAGTTGSNVALIYTGFAVFMSIAAMVFLAATIMLIVRAVVLVFLMVISPIGFAGLAIPPLEKYGNMWWQTLLQQSFFAPIMLLLIVISLKMMQSMTAIAGFNGNTLAQVLAGDGIDTSSAVIMFVMMCGFMILALVAAKRMGAYGADFAISISRKAVSMPFAYPSRAAVGFAGRKTQEGYERSGLAGIFRKVPVLGTGIDDVIAGGLKRTQDIKAGLAQSYGEKREADKKRGEHLKHEQHLAHAKSGLKAALLNPQRPDLIARAVRELNDVELGEQLADASQEQANLIAQSLSPERTKKLIENDKIPTKARDRLRSGRMASMRASIAANASAINDLEGYDLALYLSQATADERDRMAQALNPKKFDKLLENREISLATKNQLRTSRYRTMSNDANAYFSNMRAAERSPERQASDEARRKLRQRSAQDIVMSGMLNDAMVRPRLLMAMSQDQFEKVLDRDDITPEEKQVYRNERTEGFRNNLDIMDRMGRKEIAKQDSSILADPLWYTSVEDPQIFGQMQLDANLSLEQRNEIGQHIQRIATDPTHPQYAGMRAYVRGTPGARSFYNIRL